jgi:HlyD family secretion protein
MIKKLSWTAVISMVALAGLVALLIKNVAAGPANAVRPGDVALAKRTAVAAEVADFREPLAPPGTIAGNGIVEPADRETRVGAAVPGRIARVLVVEGDAVSSGTLLVELDDEPEKAALAAAQADLAVAQATLSRTEHGLRKADLDALTGDAAAAKARALLSAKVAEQSDRLANQGAVTGDQRDHDQRQAEADDGAFRASDARRRAGIEGSRPEDIAIASDQVQVALARRDEASAALERLRVRAPIDATVLQVKTRAGEYYNTQGTDPLIVLGDTRTLKIRMDVDERDIGKVKLGAPAYVTLAAYPGRRISAKLVEVGRRMGRKNVRTDDPIERNDTKILEVILEVAESSSLVPGARVTAYVNAR